MDSDCEYGACCKHGARRFAASASRRQFFRSLYSKEMPARRRRYKKGEAMQTAECPQCRMPTVNAMGKTYCPQCGWNRGEVDKQTRLFLRLLPVLVIVFDVPLI